MATNVVSYGSDLERKGWIREGLVQAAHKSFWTPFQGTTTDSIIYQTTNASAKEGHTVVFDFDGNLSSAPFKGKETATGNGEQKKKFSDLITVERYRWVVDNGDRFDAVNIDNLAGSEHSDSRNKLGDLYLRSKDQVTFDTLQGFKDGATPTHTIQIDASANPLNYQSLVDIEKSLRTGVGYKTGAFGSTTKASGRAPLAPYRMRDGRSCWLLVIDPLTAANIKGNTGAGSIMSLMSQADIRGNDNRVVSGVLGRIGMLTIVEAEVFFGQTTTNKFNGSKVEVAGLRTYDSVNSKWAGESGFADAVYSRNLILGASAMQLAIGQQPDYSWQKSTDFGINSESLLEVWMETKKTKLVAENGDYIQAKLGGLDLGVIALDVKLV